MDITGCHSLVDACRIPWHTPPTATKAILSPPRYTICRGERYFPPSVPFDIFFKLGLSPYRHELVLVSMNRVSGRGAGAQIARVSAQTRSTVYLGLVQSFDAPSSYIGSTVMTEKTTGPRYIDCCYGAHLGCSGLMSHLEIKHVYPLVHRKWLLNTLFALCGQTTRSA